MRVVNSYCPQGIVLVSLEHDESKDAVLPFYVTVAKKRAGFKTYAAALTDFWGAVELIRNEKKRLGR